MIDGLKVIVTGDELLRLLDERIAMHDAEAAHWTREAARARGDVPTEVLPPPVHLCEHEAERHEWRAEVLEFIREHLDQSETYRLGEADLEFGELLPPAPEPALFADDYLDRSEAGSAASKGAATATTVE